jgi:hypothetical protein
MLWLVVEKSTLYTSTTAGCGTWSAVTESSSIARNSPPMRMATTTEILATVNVAAVLEIIGLLR